MNTRKSEKNPSAITKTRLSLSMTVKEVLDRYPQTLQQFVNLGLLCVGCPTESFHTLADVAREYQMDPVQLLQRFQRAIGKSESPRAAKP